MSIIRGTVKPNVVYSYLVIKKEESIDIYKLGWILKCYDLPKKPGPRAHL